MANSDYPRGFECKGVPLRVNKYVAGAACYPGDLVTLSSDGKCDPCAAGTIVLGVCMTYAAADLAEILVADHPDQMVIGQVAAAEVDAQTDIGQVCDIVATAGDATYKTSRQEVDGSTLAGGSSAQLMLLGIEERPGNALGSFVKVICKISEHQLASGVNGI